ncbi:MAG: helical backbone metal receptor [Pseudomonadota bacterium]
MTRLFFSIAFFWAVLSPAHALQLLDDRGVTVKFDRVPLRIVSLLPSLTETVCELGHCNSLVGLDRYSNYPPSVRGLPQVGGGIDPIIEAVVRLKPDVVLMATSSRGAQRLEGLGIKVLALEPKGATDVKRVMGKLGQLLEVPDTDRIWRTIDSGVQAAAQSLPPAAKNVRVYYEVSVGGFAAGPSSFIGETLLRLGVKNIVGPELGPFPRINPEFVVRADPDLIMIGERNSLGLDTRPGWAGMRALREKRLCVFTPSESDVLVRPGPRMAEAARIMAKCITDKALGAPK